MHIKKTIRDLITASAERAKASGALAFETLPAFEVEATKHAEHGDLATNLALILAKQAKQPPRQVAQAIIDHLAAPEGMLLKMEIAGPGFINFFIADAYWYRVIAEIHRMGTAYGNSDLGVGRQSPGGVRQRQPHRAAAHRPRPGRGPGRCPGQSAGRHRSYGGAGILHQRRGQPDPHPGQIPLFPPAGAAGRDGGVPGGRLSGRLYERPGPGLPGPGQRRAWA